MKNKKVWSDFSFWILIGVNVFLVYHYYQHPEIFTTLLWLYWSQSVLLGVFNILDILTVRKIKMESFMVEGKLEPTSFTRRIPSAFFFAFHYGFFHVGYFVFLYTMKKSSPIQWDFLEYFFYVFLAGQIISFVQHKIQQRKEETSLGTMFITPYIRIVPMHLTILVPNFLPFSSMGIFLILKSFADVIMYIATKPSNKSREADTALLASQQGININA